MRRIFPTSSDELTPTEALGDLPGDDRRLGVRVVMVQSVDGRIAVDGRSAPLTSADDQRVYLANRALADVVIVGARTARHEGYGPSRLTPALVQERRDRGAPPAPPIAVISDSLDLDLDARFFTEAAARPIVVTTRESDAARRERIARVADLIVLDAPLDMGAVCDALTERGFRRAVLEGGPSAVGSFLAADRVDEFCVSVAPQLVGEGPGLVPPLPVPRGLALRTVLVEDGLLVLLLRPAPLPDPPPSRPSWRSAGTPG